MAKSSCKAADYTGIILRFEILVVIYSDAEVIACNVILDKINLTVVCTYIAPNISNSDFSNYISCLRQLCTSNGPHVIVGDFNLPHIDWINTIIPNDFKSQELFNWSCEFGLDQFILVPTRLNHILDLIFCNDLFLITEVKCNEPFC